MNSGKGPKDQKGKDTKGLLRQISAAAPLICQMFSALCFFINGYILKTEVKKTVLFPVDFGFIV